LHAPHPRQQSSYTMYGLSFSDSSTCLHHSHAQTKTQTLLKTPNSGLSIQLHQLQHPERLCRSGMILQCSNPSKYIEDYSNVRVSYLSLIFPIPCLRCLSYAQLNHWDRSAQLLKFATNELFGILHLTSKLLDYAINLLTATIQARSLTHSVTDNPVLP
uniref:Uncharacterized protein n=1 Tax=Aegilops tauschii subsp. strangulata TaxID=200361 RepID=A0A453B725_AEGTS